MPDTQKLPASPLPDILSPAEKERLFFNALCINYSAAYYCDLMTDELEPIKRKGFSHSAAAADEVKKRASYSGWIRLAYDTIIIKDSAPDYLEVFDAANLMRRMAETESFSYRHRTLPNARGMEYFEITVVRLYADDKHFKIILGYRPIDDLVAEENRARRQLERALHDAESANQAKTDFLRRMSHDIRTPINGILGMLEMENRHPNDVKKLQECRNKITAAAEYLVSLVDNVLDLGKVESGGFTLEHKPFDLVPLLMKQLSMVELQAGENGVNFHGGIEKSTIRHRYLIGSPIHLNRVLMNISNNAIKYNRRGGDITTYCTEVSDDGGTALFRFVCADTGLGMSESFQAHAFEPFAQEGKPTTSSYSGSGLGLAIVKEIVEQMHGTVALESREGLGSTFTLSIPFEIDHAAQHQADHPAPAAPAADLSGLRVLMAEDNALNREIAEMLLEDEGLSVTAVENGSRALDLFARSAPGEYSLILLDITMPVMDGLEAARRIRALPRPDAASIPILAMSANAFQEDVAQSRTAGMNAYLMKPLDPAKFTAAIRAALSPGAEGHCPPPLNKAKQ